jgi:hypothetical protein
VGGSETKDPSFLMAGSMTRVMMTFAKQQEQS